MKQFSFTFLILFLAIALALGVDQPAAGGMSLDQRRYLLYLYARVNRPKEAESLARDILRDNPGDKQTLLVLASMYVERKSAKKALDAARQVLKFYPNDHQGVYFFAAAHYLLRQYRESNELLKDLKEEQFQNELYPYQTDLASAAFKAGDWFRSMAAYQELLRYHNLNDELRQEARRVLEGIYRERLPQVSLEERMALLKSGGVYRTRLDYRQHIEDKQRVFFGIHRDDINLQASNFLLDGWYARHMGWAGLETTYSSHWSSRVSIGGEQEGLLGSAGMTRSFGEGRDLTLEGRGNDRATDSLLLESLNGRENRVELKGNYKFNEKWLAYGSLYARQLTLAQEELGLSSGGNFNLEHILLHDSPELRVGYRSVWMNYSQSSTDDLLIASRLQPFTPAADRRQTFENLVVSEIHREGVYATLRDQLSGLIYYFITTGTDYAFELGSMEWNAAGGLSVYPRKSLELRGEIGYISSASTSNLDSDQWLVVLGIKYWF